MLKNDIDVYLPSHELKRYLKELRNFDTIIFFIHISMKGLICMFYIVDYYYRSWKLTNGTNN